MNCKVKWTLAFIVIIAAGLYVAHLIPQDTEARIVQVVIVAACVVGAVIVTLSILRIRPNPYRGAANLRRQARKVAAHDGIPVSTAVQQIYEAEKAKGHTTPKIELDTIPRPVLVDKAHMQHIRTNEGMAKPGYDVPAQKPALPAPLTWDEIATAWYKEQANKALEDKES